MARSAAFQVSPEVFAAAVLDTTREPLLVLDEDFQIRMANRAFLKVFAVSEEETVGRRISELGNGQWHLPAFMDALAEILPSGSEITDFEIEHDFPRVGTRTILLNARELERPSGDPMIFVAMQDVTELRTASRLLASASAELSRSNRDLEQFAFVASHDLQEPLRKIRTFGGLFLKAVDKNITPEAGDYLARMMNAAERMQNLLGDLLGFARARVRPATLSEVNLADVCHEALVDLEAAVKEANATVSIGPLPTVRGDSSQLRQLFQNLLSNGVKYRKEGVEPSITVSSTETPGTAVGGARSHHIQVRDNGIGFDQAYAATIFEPFRRLHARFEYEGNGIGLAICRTIVERHRGTIEAAGAPGSGATFTVILPSKPAVEEAQ